MGARRGTGVADTVVMRATFAASLICLAALVPGCPDAWLGDETSVQARPADLAGPRVVWTTLGPTAGLGRLGRSAAIDVRFSEPVDPATLTVDTALVVSGAPDAAFLTDIEAPPLAQERAAQTVPVAIAPLGAGASDAWRIAPLVALEPGANFALVLSSAIRDLHGARLCGADGRRASFVHQFFVDPAAGLTLVVPPSGAAEVPPNLARIVAVYEQAPEDLALVGPDGALVPMASIGRAEDVCAVLDLSLDRCAALVPAASLEPAAAYRLVEPAGAEASFTTGSAIDTQPPALAPQSCGLGETALGDLCARIRDDRALLRLVASERVEARLSVDSGPSASAPIFATVQTLALAGLVADRGYVLRLEIRDLAGNPSDQPVAIRTLLPQPTLAITEVYHDPRGAEPGQEFVEIHNWGPAPVALGGLWVSDGGASEGDIIGSTDLLSPGGFALVVATAYDPSGASGDAPSAPSALLVRIGSSIGTNGLANAGESVELYRSDGTLLSRWPGGLVPRAGTSIERMDPSGSDDDPSNWRYNESASSSPGSF